MTHPKQLEEDRQSALQTNLAILSDLLRQSCVELMTDYGLPAELQLPSSSSLLPTGTLMAAIDFDGRDLRGTVAIRVSQTVVVETYRTACGSAPAGASPALEDWTCELANQLVGRLKNKLQRFDVSFTVNMPRLIATRKYPELERALCNRFVCDRGAFTGYLDVLVAPELAFQAQPIESAPSEGDLVIF